MKKLLIGAVGLAMLLPTGARAAGDSQCGGAWTGPTTCPFGPSTGNLILRVSGSAHTANGPTHVHAWADVGPQGLVVRTECSADSASSNASCAIERALPTPFPTIPHIDVPLKIITCGVEGTTGGQYECRTGV